MTKDWTTPEGLDELEKYCLKPGDLFNVSRISDGRNFWALVDSVPQLIAKISELQTIPELVSDCVSCKQYFNDVQLMAAKIIQLKSKIHNQAARIEELEAVVKESLTTQFQPRSFFEAETRFYLNQLKKELRND